MPEIDFLNKKTFASKHPVYDKLGRKEQRLNPLQLSAKGTRLRTNKVSKLM